MRRLADAALGALVGAGLAVGATAGSAPNPQFAIRNPQFPDWRVVGVVVEDAAGQRVILPLAGLDAPTSTATTLPAPTPTPPPTNTPRPAPTSTTSATLMPTPTQEVTALPPLTPRPTIPSPDEALCMAGVRTAALNIRADPSTSAAVLGVLAGGERVAIDALFVRYPAGLTNREEWGRLADGRGWVALWYAGNQLAVLDDSPACWEVATNGAPGA